MSSNLFNNTTRDRHNTSTYDYMVTNFVKDCGIPDVRKIAYTNKGINIRDGYGYVAKDGCAIDNDSEVRIPNKDGVTLERNHPLPALPCITPFKGRGDYDIDQDSDLKYSSATRVRRENGVLSGVSIDRFEDRDSKKTRQHADKLVLPSGVIGISTRHDDC